MRKIFNILLLTLAFAIVQSPSLFAQKFGYLNINNILADMPTAQSANSALETLQKQRESEITKEAEAFQAKYMKVLQDIDAGIYSQIQIQQKEEELKAEQARLQKMEQDATLEIMQKREELLAPILKNLETAVNDVAKENGFQFIFNESVFNALLYVDEASDVAQLVRQKLGMK